jgi:hypothetical protein
MEQFWFLIGALKVDADELILSLLFADADPLVVLKIQQTIRQFPGPWACQPLWRGFGCGQMLA